jgi:hypothetical protein
VLAVPKAGAAGSGVAGGRRGFESARARGPGPGARAGVALVTGPTGCAQCAGVPVVARQS